MGIFAASSLAGRKFPFGYPCEAGCREFTPQIEATQSRQTYIPHALCAMWNNTADLWSWMSGTGNNCTLHALNTTDP